MPKFSGAPSGAPKGSKTIDLGFDSLLFWGRMGEGSDSNFYKNTPLYKNTPPIPPPILIRGVFLKGKLIPGVSTLQNSCFYLLSILRPFFVLHGT